jgi:microcystin-dependent protein
LRWRWPPVSWERRQAVGQVTGLAGGNAPVADYQASLALTQQIDTRGVFPCNGCGAGGIATSTLGMMRTFAGNFAAFGQPTANGALLPIAQETAVFSILGTTYGGNGVQNFALPNLGGRAIVGSGQGASLSNWNLGQTGS